MNLRDVVRAVAALDESNMAAQRKAQANSIT
jgi:hypothetical protein